jgi:hypothetical protein
MTKLQAPCNTQDQKQVEAYYRNVKPGDIAVIRDTRGHFLHYQVDTVTDTNPKIGRIYLQQGDPWGGRAWYPKSGKPSRASNGQAQLVVPTDEVLAWIKAYEGKLPASTSDVDVDTTPPGQRGEGYQRRQSVLDIMMGVRRK